MTTRNTGASCNRATVRVEGERIVLSPPAHRPFGHGQKRSLAFFMFCCFHLAKLANAAGDMPKISWKASSDRYCSFRFGSTSAGREVFELRRSSYGYFFSAGSEYSCPESFASSLRMRLLVSPVR